MHDSESASLRSAAIVLLVVSCVRWGLAQQGMDRVDVGAGVLVEHAQATREAATADAAARRPLEADERIDPNRAGPTELDRLPGVGPSTARAIVAARDSGVVFRRVRDLILVRGIGPASVDRIGPWLDFRSPPARAPTSGSRTSGRRMSRSPGLRTTGAGGLDGPTMVDVNRAGTDELVRLPGIGPVLAGRIVQERAKGAFSSLADLSRVSGIGPAMVERLRGVAIVRGGW